LTAGAIIVQLTSLTVILNLLFLREDLPKAGLAIGRKPSMARTVDSKNAVFCLLIILIILNGAYFSSQFMEKTLLYEDHGLTTISDALNRFGSDGSLVFANNYIYVRSHINDKMFKQGLLLPPPDTNEEFLELLKTAPNNTYFLISNDSATTWYDYSNDYIKGCAYSHIITTENPGISKFQRILKLSLPEGQAELFSVINDKDVDQSIAVKDSGINVDENRTVTLEMQIESPRSKNVTILVATDRFTKVHVVSLDTGVNNIKFQFDYIIDPSRDQPDEFYQLYWLYLAQARLIVIEDYAISYNKFVTTQDLKLMNVLLLTLLLGILSILSYCSYKARAQASVK